MAENDPKSGSPTGILHSSEIKAAFGGPAFHSDRFIVTTNSAGVRIGFLEADTVSQPPNFRTAVLISYSDAIELWKLLQKMLAGVERQIEAAKIASTKPNA